MNSKKEDQLQVEKLSTLIRTHSNNYHVLDEPEIEDSEIRSSISRTIVLRRKIP